MSASVAVEHSYLLEGSVLDVYRGVPFWFDGAGHDQGSTSVTTWLIDKGEIAGVGVSDTAVVTVAARQPGVGGLASRLILVDEEAAPEVVRWVVDAFQGRLGGPLGELAAKTGEQVGFYQVPISYRIEESKSAISATDRVKVTAIGRRIPRWHPAGSAAPWQRSWIGTGSQVRVRVPEYGMDFELSGARADGGSFRFES